MRELLGTFARHERIAWALSREEALDLAAAGASRPADTTSISPTEAEWRRGPDLHVYVPDGALFDAVAKEPLDAGVHLAAFGIDEWLEECPHPTENAAVAFRYSTARTEAPNAILICVPDDEQSGWTSAQLARCIANVIELMRLRTLTADDLLAVAGLRSPVPCLDHDFTVDVAGAETLLDVGGGKFSAGAGGLATGAIGVQPARFVRAPSA